MAIDAGEYFSEAALAGGTVWTWGENNYGQLGNGIYVNSNVPLRVHRLTNVVGIAVSGDFALSTRTGSGLTGQPR